MADVAEKKDSYTLKTSRHNLGRYGCGTLSVSGYPELRCAEAASRRSLGDKQRSHQSNTTPELGSRRRSEQSNAQ